MSKTSKRENLNSCGDENNIKCGDIMFSNNTTFCFQCTFCQEKCYKIKEFFRHVLYDHLNYLEEYQFDEDEDLLPKIGDPNKTIEDEMEFINVGIQENSKKAKQNVGFSNHFEEFVCQNIPSSVSIKSEAEDDDEEDDENYKDDLEEFEFFLENEQALASSPPLPMKQRSPSPDSKKNFDDILHIEFLEEPSENEYEPENTDITEVHSYKDDSDEEEDNDEDDVEEASNSCPETQYTINSDGEDEEEEELHPKLIISDLGKTKENNYKCPYEECKKVFMTKNGAKRHIQNIHKSYNQGIACKTCFKTFNSKGQLDRHMLRHLGVKPHPCEICGQCFSDKSNLNVHVMRHKGIKPHACSLCEKRFHSSTELKLHTRSHTGERPFVCEQCGRKFSNSGHLCNHRRRHLGEKKFECDFCQKRFYDRKLLNDHKVMHTTERPFECKICASTFQRKKALLQHEKLHSAVKQYVCKICGKSFAQNAGLYSHMKGH